jgi:hypothetical protein
MEDIKLVKKTTNWNAMGKINNSRPEIRWRNEVINYLGKIKLGNWLQIVKESKVWNVMVQKSKTRVGL